MIRFWTLRGSIATTTATTVTRLSFLSVGCTERVVQAAPGARQRCSIGGRMALRQEAAGL